MLLQTRIWFKAFSVLLLVVGLVGCGQSGPLYLPQAVSHPHQPAHPVLSGQHHHATVQPDPTVHGE